MLMSPSSRQWNRWETLWWKSLSASINETILPLLYYMLRNTMKIFPKLHVQTHIYKSLLLLQQFNNSCEAQQPCTKFPLQSLPVHLPTAAAPWLPSGFLGCSFGFPVGSCFDLGHLHICQGVRGKAWAHAFNGLLLRCPLLLQRANHVLHFALSRKEVLNTRLQCLNLLPCSLEDGDISKYKAHHTHGHLGRRVNKKWSSYALWELHKSQH